MGIRSMFEDMLKFRVKPADDDLTKTNIASSKDDIADKSLDNGKGIIDVAELQKFRSLSGYRSERYASYENMLSDPVISAALQMYADDATQYNTDGDIIWVESDDEQSKDIVAAGNRLLDVLNIKSQAWKHIYSLCTYGDIYFKLFQRGDDDSVTPTDSNQVKVKPSDDTRELEEYIQYVNDPGSIFEIQKRDKTCGFVEVSEPQNNKKNQSVWNNSYLTTVPKSGTTIYNRTSFVHISINECISRSPECLGIQNEEGTQTTIYQVKTGKSILEDAYSATQDLKLLEDSMLLNRLSRSALIRLLQIEVGDMARPQVESLLHRVKNLIEQRVSLNTNTSEMRSYNAPGPLDNFVYLPTKNGKGKVEVNNLGGEVNVRDIVDIEYFNNKKLAALRIPKEFMNYDSPEGIGNGGQLTKKSSRYAHTIMRIQSAYCSGIQTLLNLFFISKGLKDYVNKFTVRMVSPATGEDTERDEQLSLHIDQASDLYSFFEDASPETKKEALVYLLGSVVKNDKLSELLQNDESEQVPDNVDSSGDPNISTDNDDTMSDINDELPEMPDDFNDELPEVPEEPTMTPEA